MAAMATGSTPLDSGPLIDIVSSRREHGKKEISNLSGMLNSAEEAP
jgi:hypothetical protein